MSISNKKAEKLLMVAKKYYEEEKTQNEIAKELGVSRPLISRMIHEAREYGIVKIELCPIGSGNNLLLNQVRNLFALKDGIIVRDKANDNETNKMVTEQIIEYLHKEMPHIKNVGLGWGSMMGKVLNCMPLIVPKNGQRQLEIVPLIGNSSVSNRNYHTNESVRIFAEKTGGDAKYLYAPALAENQIEYDTILQLENVKAVEEVWRELDLAVVNIGNYPSTPDFGSAVRFGSLLQEKKVVGRILNYYVTQDGEILNSDHDYAIQIPLQTLANAGTVLGICASNVTPRALLGALHSGILTAVIAPESITKAAIALKQLHM